MPEGMGGNIGGTGQGSRPQCGVRDHSIGKNNFLEVARKRAVSKDGTTEFVSISRGYTMRDGSERYKSSLTIPEDEEVRKFLIEKLSSI
jgi:hypothetical protein